MSGLAEKEGGFSMLGYISIVEVRTERSVTLEVGMKLVGLRFASHMIDNTFTCFYTQLRRLKLEKIAILPLFITDLDIAKEAHSTYYHSYSMLATPDQTRSRAWFQSFLIAQN